MAQVKALGLGGIGSPCCCGGTPVVTCYPCNLPEQDLVLTITGTVYVIDYPTSCSDSTATAFSASYPLNFISTSSGWATPCINNTNYPSIYFVSTGNYASWVFSLTCTGGNILLYCYFYGSSGYPDFTPQCATTSSYCRSGVGGQLAYQGTSTCSPLNLVYNSTTCTNLGNVNGYCSLGPFLAPGYYPSAALTEIVITA